MNTPHLASIEATPEQITPLYDKLLVRRLHEEEYAGLIVPSDMVLAPSGKWVKKGDTGPRRGVVLAAGRGDKGEWRCQWCWKPAHEPSEGELYVCPNCGTQGMYNRKPMDVRVGDVILYPRFESSHVVLGGEQYTFVHEADVLAVLDRITPPAE